VPNAAVRPRFAETAGDAAADRMRQAALEAAEGVVGLRGIFAL